MTVILIGRYQKNESATAIEYRRYSDRNEDQYPTFSICLIGDGLYRYNGNTIYEAYGINPGNYEGMLQGETAFRYEYDPTSKLYDKISVPMKHQTHFASEHIVQKSNALSDIIQYAQSDFENKNDSLYYEKDEFFYGITLERPPFYISFQTPQKRCLTRQWRDNNNFERVRDHIRLDMSFLDLWADIHLFFHYPGQLIRNLDSPSLESDSDTMRGKAFQIKVSQSTVWKRRSVKDKPCLEGIDDYDRYFQDYVVDTKIGCVPPYWMDTINRTSDQELCTSPKTLKEANEYIDEYKILMDEIKTPCLDMFNSIVWNQVNFSQSLDRFGSLDRTPETLGRYTFLEIFYAEKYYEEIRQEEDFNIQDFISNLGGFIGIFLGYSMMQIPELLKMAINQANTIAATGIVNCKRLMGGRRVSYETESDPRTSNMTSQLKPIDDWDEKSLREILQRNQEQTNARLSVLAKKISIFTYQINQLTSRMDENEAQIFAVKRHLRS